MEKEAERSRAELSAMLENCWSAQQQAFQANREDDAIAELREELSLQEVSPGRRQGVGLVGAYGLA